MSDQWFYTMLGSTFGPVPFEALAKLASDGILQRDESLRREKDEGWVPADSIVGLFPEQPLSKDAESNLPDRAADGFAGADDLEQWIATNTAEWYCRTIDDEWGPVTFAQIEKLVLTEQLVRSDRIRRQEMEWVRAGEVAGLEAVFRKRDLLNATRVLQAGEILNTGGQQSVADDEREIAKSFASPAEAGTSKTARKKPRKLKPVSGERVKSSLPREKTVDNPVDTESAIDLEQEDWERELFDVVDKEDRIPIRSSAPNRRSGTKSRAIVDDSPPDPPTPVATLPRTESVASAALRQVSAPPITKSRLRGNPFQGRSRTLLIGGAAIAVLAVAGYVVFRMTVGYTGGEYYNRLSAIVAKFRELRQRGASDAEFDAFEKTAREELAPMIKALEKRATSKSAANRELLYASQDLLRMLKDARKSVSPSEQKFDERMEVAKKLR